MNGKVLGFHLKVMLHKLQFLYMLRHLVEIFEFYYQYCHENRIFFFFYVRKLKHVLLTTNMMNFGTTA